MAEWHSDWWWYCSPERWGWWPGCLREWGSPASHGSVVRGSLSLHRHGALNGYSPPILQPRLRSPPEAPLQPDFLRHFCWGETLACRVSFISHGLVPGVQRGASTSHYHEGMAKRGLHQPHVRWRLLGVLQEYRQPLRVVQPDEQLDRARWCVHPWHVRSDRWEHLLGLRGQTCLRHRGDLLHLEGTDHLMFPSHIDQWEEMASRDRDCGSPEAIHDSLRHLRWSES